MNNRIKILIGQDWASRPCLLATRICSLSIDVRCIQILAVTYTSVVCKTCVQFSVLSLCPVWDGDGT